MSDGGRQGGQPWFNSGRARKQTSTHTHTHFFKTACQATRVLVLIQNAFIWQRNASLHPRPTSTGPEWSQWGFDVGPGVEQYHSSAVRTGLYIGWILLDSNDTVIK